MVRCKKCGKQIAASYKRYCDTCLNDPTPLKTVSGKRPNIDPTPLKKVSGKQSNTPISPTWLFIWAIILGLLYAHHRTTKPAFDPPPAISKSVPEFVGGGPEEIFRQLSPKEHLEKAHLLLKVGSPQSSIDEGLKNLDAILASTPEFSSAVKLRREYDAARKKHDEEQARIQASEAKKDAAAAHAEYIALRDAMAKNLENNMLDEGFDVHAQAIGKDHTTLHIKWILADRVMVHQMSKRHDFFQNARAVGFCRIEITDGYDDSWHWIL
jgi:hypothetical protein